MRTAILLIRWSMKERSGFITVAAWFIWPMSDCSCLFVADRLVDHRCIVLRSWVSLVSGNLNSCLREFIVFHKKIIEVERPTTLSGATGRPDSLKRGKVSLRASFAAEEDGREQKLSR